MIWFPLFISVFNDAQSFGDVGEDAIVLVARRKQNTSDKKMAQERSGTISRQAKCDDEEIAN